MNPSYAFEPLKGNADLPCQCCGDMVHNELLYYRDETGERLCAACIAEQVQKELDPSQMVVLRTTYNGWTIQKATDPWAIQLCGAVWEATCEGAAVYSDNIYDLVDSLLTKVRANERFAHQTATR